MIFFFVSPSCGRIFVAATCEQVTSTTRPYSVPVATMKSIVAAAVACSLLSAPASALQASESTFGTKVFNYHHAAGKASQRGQHSEHSASQIALPQMRFASQHATVAEGSTQQLAATAEALTRAAARSSASAESLSERTHAKLSHSHSRSKVGSKAKAKAKAKSEASATAEAVPGGGAAESGPATSHINGYPGDNSVITMKLSSPIYGSYTRNYGSVSQPLTETSGYGGFTSNVDPTGFNFRHDDTTPNGGQKGWGASTLSGHPFGSTYPARMKVRQATSVNGLSPLGLTATMSDSEYTLMGPKSLGPYGVDGVGTMNTGPGANVVGVGLALPPLTAGPSSTVMSIPAAAAAGSGRKASPAKSKVVVINKPSTPQVQLAGMGNSFHESPGPLAGMSVSEQPPSGGSSSSIAQLTGRPLSNGSPINGMRLTYDPMLVTQRALYMQGGINTYGTPGVIKQLGVSYPSPAFDRYASVVPTSKLSTQVHTSPLSNLLLGANINANMQRNLWAQRADMGLNPITGLPVVMDPTMMGMSSAMGMPGAMGGTGAMGGGMGGMGGGMGAMGGGMGGMGGGMGGMGGMGMGGV